MKKFVFWILILICGTANAQVMFQFLPEIQGRNVDGLMGVRLNNLSGEKQTVKLQIAVTERKAGRVLVMRTQPFLLAPGLSAMRGEILKSANISFSENKIASIVRQSAYFPNGEYEYCFEIFNENDHYSSAVSDECFEYLLEPLSPLMLVEPFDRSKICEKRPMFSWQPMMPAIPGMLYRLTLVEIKGEQGANEAIHYNIPMINQPGISNPLMIYPPATRELEENKKYAWQVTAYKNDVVMARSEVWEFVVKCTEVEPPQPNEGFRNIEDLAKGNFYVANGHLLFSIRNPYEKRELKYRIVCLNAPETKIGKLPRVILERGANNVSIDLGDNRSFKEGYSYIMTVEVPNGSKQKLRFLYKEVK